MRDKRCSWLRPHLRGAAVLVIALVAVSGCVNDAASTGTPAASVPVDGAEPAASAPVLGAEPTTTGGSAASLPSSGSDTSADGGAVASDPARVSYGLPVDESAIPASEDGVSGPNVGPATSTKYLTGDNVGAFRVSCSLSHMNFDDPIVWPGEVGRTHLHIFFGNTGVDADSNSDSIQNAGNTTCTGGTLNRSAYWAPAMIDTDTGRPIVESQHLDNFLQVYYKTGYKGVPTDTVQNFPPGLRIVAGDATNSEPAENSWGPVQYSCLATGERGDRSGFPTCDPGDHLVMAVTFPQCWDGVNLDSADHRSHMADGVGWGKGVDGLGCPPTHPVPLPEITQNFRYLVPTEGMSSWRLSSDVYEGTAGYSGHADWWNGWDAPTFQRVIDNCYQGGWDCRMNLLGDGDALL